MQFVTGSTSQGTAESPGRASLQFWIWCCSAEQPWCSSTPSLFSEPLAALAGTFRSHWFCRQLPGHTAALALSCQAPQSLFLAVALTAAAISVCISSRAKARIPLCCRLGAPGAQPRAPQRGCEQGQSSQPTLPAATGGKGHHLLPKHLRITELRPG